MNDNIKSKSYTELKKKLSRERKQVSEDLMKEKLDKKKLKSLREYELYNMSTTAKMIITEADKRKTSTGAHFREDS